MRRSSNQAFWQFFACLCLAVCVAFGCLYAYYKFTEADRTAAALRDAVKAVEKMK